MHRSFLERHGLIAAIGGAFVAAGLMTSAASAQGLSNYYQPEQGELQENWYETEDWSSTEWYEDTEGDVDEWLHSDYDYGYVEDEAAFRRYDYDAYYDGYYDGYHQRPSTFKEGLERREGDQQTMGRRSQNYRTAYTNGYQDGSYDQQNQYDADPYYYVYVVDMSEQGQTSDEQRAEDNTRKRGDRCSQFTRRGTDPYKTDRASHRDRVRGTVTEITPVKMEGNHHIVRMSFQEGETVTADFGPHMNQNLLPASQGDRVTLIGREKQRDGKKILVTNKLIVNDETYTLRGVSKDADQQTSPGNRQEQRDRRDQAPRDEMQGKNTTLRGQVTRLEKTDLEDVNPPSKKLARLELQDGRTAILAFSDNINIDNLEISSGDQVTIRGKEKQIKGQTIIEVEGVLVNGRPIDVTGG